MSVWDVEVTYLDSDLMAYVKIYDDYSGNITGTLRKVRCIDGHYYIKADGRQINLDNQIAGLLEYKDMTERAISFYKKHSGKYLK